jgi:hypothetical protein
VSNDIRFIWQAAGRSPVDGANDDLLSMQMIRRLWCTRKLAAAVYDANFGLQGFVGEIPALKEVSKNGHPLLSTELAAAKFMPLAKSLRNRNSHFFETTGRDPLDNHMSGFQSETEHKIYAHNQTGNSISELVEQIFTLPKILNFRKGLTLEEFDNWCLKCSGSIVKFCNKGTVRIIMDAFPNKVGQKRSIPVVNEAFDLKTRWPLFMILDEDAV